MKSEEQQNKGWFVIRTLWQSTTTPRSSLVIFQIRDLILRKVTTTTKDPTQGKVGPNWEGPYKIVDCHKKGSCYLETLNQQRLHHP